MMLNNQKVITTHGKKIEKKKKRIDRQLKNNIALTTLKWQHALMTFAKSD